MQIRRRFSEDKAWLENANKLTGESHLPVRLARDFADERGPPVLSPDAPRSERAAVWMLQREIILLLASAPTPKSRL